MRWEDKSSSLAAFFTAPTASCASFLCMFYFTSKNMAWPHELVSSWQFVHATHYRSIFTMLFYFRFLCIVLLCLIFALFYCWLWIVSFPQCLNWLLFIFCLAPLMFSILKISRMLLFGLPMPTPPLFAPSIETRHCLIPHCCQGKCHGTYALSPQQ